MEVEQDLPPIIRILVFLFRAMRLLLDGFTGPVVAE